MTATVRPEQRIIEGCPAPSPPPPAPPSAPTPRGRGRLFWVGLAMVVAGLVLLAYVAWQVFGTNVVSHRRQRDLVARTERVWASERATSIAGDGRDGVADALIRIPRFGRDYVQPVQAGVSEGVLAEGFGHFDGTAGPGQVGNYAVAAHRVTHGQPLREMPDLRPGDTVVVDTRDRTFVYKLDTDPNRLVVDQHDIWVVDPLPHNPQGGVQPAQRPGQRLLTLTTCAELFHTDDRMIVFGHLVSSRARAAAALG